MHLPAGIDQQEVQHDVHQVHIQADPHRGFGIPHGAQNRGKYNAGGAEEHRAIEDEEILGCHIPDGHIHLHPLGDFPAEACGDGGEQQPHDHSHYDRLGRGPPGPLPVPCSIALGDQGQEANAHR